MRPVTLGSSDVVAWMGTGIAVFSGTMVVGTRMMLTPSAVVRVCAGGRVLLVVMETAGAIETTCCRFATCGSEEITLVAILNTF